MRVRHLIGGRKELKKDTGWRTSDAAPRHVPVLVRTKRTTPGWQWRAARASDGGGRDFAVYAQARPGRDNWSAWLMVATAAGWSLVARYEHHGYEPGGLHVHSDCTRSGQQPGPESIDGLPRRPAADRYHRRTPQWQLDTFWRAAMDFFRIQSPLGPLFDGTYVES